MESKDQAPDGSWLWCQLMEWCRKQRIAPATQNDLFAIVGRAHEHNHANSEYKEMYEALVEDAERLGVKLLNKSDNWFHRLTVLVNIGSNEYVRMKNKPQVILEAFPDSPPEASDVTVQVEDGVATGITVTAKKPEMSRHDIQYYYGSEGLKRHDAGQKFFHPTRQYFYRNDKCTAWTSDDMDCVCWHDEGTGPLAYANVQKKWRDKA